jgi:hypothetical protein
MLLLNHGVGRGSAIMFDSGCVPEEAFPLPPHLGGEATEEPADVAVSMAWGGGGEEKQGSQQ